MHSKLTICGAFLVGLLYLTIEANGCGFPMPAPSCGCGRRKRSIEEYSTTQNIVKPSDRTEDCPQSDWLSTLTLNMNTDAKESAFLIKNALYQKYSSRFFVLCIPKGQQYFVANGEAYCSVQNDDLWCHAAAILG